jgi:hypothetical protein
MTEASALAEYYAETPGDAARERKWRRYDARQAAWPLQATTSLRTVVAVNDLGYAIAVVLPRAASLGELQRAALARFGGVLADGSPMPAVVQIGASPYAQLAGAAEESGAAASSSLVPAICEHRCVFFFILQPRRPMPAPFIALVDRLRRHVTRLPLDREETCAEFLHRAERAVAAARKDVARCENADDGSASASITLFAVGSSTTRLRVVPDVAQAFAPTPDELLLPCTEPAQRIYSEPYSVLYYAPAVRYARINFNN